jgi:cobalamin biosynthesis Mg chelatase CobN
MPKKTTNSRGGAQRNRPKVQKNVELVRSVSDEQGIEDNDSNNAEAAAVSVTAVAAPPEIRQSAAKREETKQSETKENATAASPKGSAAARVASRRVATQRIQQRAAATLVTAEHYVYVRQDLRFIAILAFIMVVVLIILRFVPGIGY